MKHTFSSPFISVIFPCFNEEKSIVSSVANAKKALAPYRKNHKAEIIVVDNNSTDRSAHLAKKAGARIVRETVKGYGAALKTGFSRAKGDILIMADADNTYPLADIPKFIREIQKGADMVLGSRFQGKMDRNAMPFFNRYIGNPLLTGLLNIFYGASISDTQTGMRAFTKSAIQNMHLAYDGMELASEIIIKAISLHLTVKEIPISYHERVGYSKLSPIRDAIRHILSILIFSPTYAFLFPGIVLFGIGITGALTLINGPIYIGNFMVDIHTMIITILAAISGCTIMLLGVFTRLYTVKHLGIQGGSLTDFIVKRISVTSLFTTGIVLLLLGFIVILTITIGWISSGFHELAQERVLLFGTGVCVIGIQFLSGSVLFSLITEK